LIGQVDTLLQESENPAYGGRLTSSSQQGSLSDLPLFSSPSMPNISLGRPHVPSSSSVSARIDGSLSLEMIHPRITLLTRYLRTCLFINVYDPYRFRPIAIPLSQSGTKLAPVSEAEVRAAFTARLGMPLTGQMLHGTLPFYPSLTVINGEPTYIHKQMQQNLQEQTAPAPPAAVGGSRQHPAAAAAVYHTAAPITDTQVAHARLHKAGHRPLGSMFPLCLRRSLYAPVHPVYPVLMGNGLRKKKSPYVYFAGGAGLIPVVRSSGHPEILSGTIPA